MKNFVKFLAVIFVMYLIGSCEYDDKFIIDEHDGVNGKDGKDGLSTVANVEIVYDSNGRRGAKTSYYWDSDQIPGYSLGDLPQNKFFVLWDGVDGKTPVMNYGIIQSNTCSSGYKMFFISSLEEKVLGDTVYFCVPANGTNGLTLTPTLETTEYPYGVVYKWYIGDSKISENLITNGKDGKPASALVCLTLEYDFQGAGATYFSSTGFVLDKFIYSESDGALYLHYSCGSLLFPPFIDNMDLLSLMFHYGSKNPYDVVVKAVYADESEEVIGEVHLDGNPNFQKNVYSTYSLFEYHANLENIKFKDIKQIKIEGKRDTSRKCVPEDLFIDQVIINLLDRNH